MKKVSLTPAVFHLSDKVNAVAHEYGNQPIVPRGPGLKPILDRLRAKVVEELNVTDTHETVIFTASGSGAIAATMGSCIDEKGILVIANDAYGERQVKFCEQLGIKTIAYTPKWGTRPDLDELERLANKHNVGTIGMVHGCTSIGLLNPIADIGKLAKKLNLRFIVDAIASIYVEELDINNWHIDALISSTNKGLHSHPDLSFCVISKDYLEEMSQRPGRIPYLDICDTWQKQIAGSHPYTINIRALMEFEAAFDDYVNRGGLKARMAMYQERVNVLREGYAKLGLETFHKDNLAQQNIGTALYLPEGVQYQELADMMAAWKNDDQECYEIYSAQGKLSGRVFRIFNMGEYSIKTYHRFLIALESCLKKCRGSGFAIRY
ncbi:MAG: alanine--glyoxylate aminotransferase family protein [Proteobacteria bacterium]|nr:alanine--glyoxylate aminotransferase family protein [Pseudomonadota bacterium]